MSTTHYEQTIAALGVDSLTTDQHDWAQQRARAERRRDIQDWAASAAAFCVCAASVVYTYTVGGWAAAVIAAMIIVVAALPVAAGLAALDHLKTRREHR